MSRVRFLLAGILKLVVGAASVILAVAAYKLLAHPLIESGFHLGAAASSIVRRFGILGVLVASYAAFVHLYEKRAPTELALRASRTLLGGAAGALSIGLTVLALYATGQYQLLASRSVIPATDVLGVLWVAAVLEEVLFRAILFRILEERVGTPAAALASALVFGVVHMSNHGAHALTLLTVTLAGLMWAGVYVLSRNLWVVTAFHFCWNSTIFAVGLPLSGESDVRVKAPLQTAMRGSTLWTGGAFGPEDSLINVVVSIAICVALWQLIRRRGLLLASGGVAATPARAGDSAAPAVP